MFPSIDEAFGSHPKSLGIIIVRDLPPEYPVYRERLLKLAYQFAQLPEDVQEKYVHSASRYKYVVDRSPFGLWFDSSVVALAGHMARYGGIIVPSVHCNTACNHKGNHEREARSDNLLFNVHLFHLFFSLIDTLKGSYYANPVVDKPSVSQSEQERYPEYYGQNICKDVTSALWNI